MAPEHHHGEAARGPLEGFERATVFAFLVARGWHLSRALGQIAVSLRRSRSRAALLGGYGLVAAESLWAGRRLWKRGTLDDRTVLVVDAAACLVANVATKRTLSSTERGRDLDWGVAVMVSHHIGLGLSSGFNPTGWVQAAGSTLLSWGIQRLGLGTYPGDPEVPIPTALYPLVFGIAATFAHQGRRIATALARERDAETELQRQAGRTRVRQEQFHVLQTRVLPALAGLASDWDPQDPAVRRRLGVEGSRIRHLLLAGEYEPIAAEVRDSLVDVVEAATETGLDIELVFLSGGEDVGPVPRAAVVALTRATAEALTNVQRHSATSKAVVCVALDAEEVSVTVRDHGRGFAGDPTAFGEGLRRNVIERVRHVGGCVRIHTGPGLGTLVEIRVPRRPAGPPKGPSD